MLPDVLAVAAEVVPTPGGGCVDGFGGLGPGGPVPGGPGGCGGML